MPEFEIQHYVQKKLLDNFARHTPNGKFKVGFIDTYNFKVGYRNTGKMFYLRNMYDVRGDDIKALEKKLKTNIEDPMMNIVERLSKSLDNIVITRKELMIIKKYILIQLYRNYRNMTAYTRPVKGVDISVYDIQEGEGKLDFWKREMGIILDQEWDEIIKSDHVSIKKCALELHTGFLMFFRTDGEFVINDSGLVNERFPVEIPVSFHDKFIELARNSGMYYNDERFSDIGEKVAKSELERKSSYFDTCTWMPLSSNFGVANVNALFKMLYINPSVISEIKHLLPQDLMKSVPFRHLSLPLPEYVNQKMMTLNIGNLSEPELLERYKDENDRYTYKTHLLEKWDTDHFNLLMMNEVFRYLCFKTPEGVIPAIIEYNKMKASGLDNIKQNYGGFVDLLKNLPPFDVCS